jgi:hypothetical protein
MKRFTTYATTLAAGLALGAPAFAQQTFERLDGESAMQMASRIGACDDAGIASARFTDAENILRVSCVGAVGGPDLSGGLGTGAAVAGGVVLAAVAVAALDSSSSTSSSGAN